MVDFELVEKLREKANISYEEAKAALEKTNGDILEAIINLEKENRIEAPKDSGYYNSKDSDHNTGNSAHYRDSKGDFRGADGTSFREMARRFFKWCGKLFSKGNRNSFDISKDGVKVMSIPVTVLVLLLLFIFWLTLPLIVIGLFFGYRYSFAGPDLGKETVNRTLDSVATAAENLKKEVKVNKNERADGENPNN